MKVAAERKTKGTSRAGVYDAMELRLPKGIDMVEHTDRVEFIVKETFRKIGSMHTAAAIVRGDRREADDFVISREDWLANLEAWRLAYGVKYPTQLAEPPTDPFPRRQTKREAKEAYFEWVVGELFRAAEAAEGGAT